DARNRSCPARFHSVRRPARRCTGRSCSENPSEWLQDEGRCPGRQSRSCTERDSRSSAALPSTTLKEIHKEARSVFSCRKILSQCENLLHFSLCCSRPRRAYGLRRRRPHMSSSCTRTTFMGSFCRGLESGEWGKLPQSFDAQSPTSFWMPAISVPELFLPTSSGVSRRSRP